LSFGHLTEEMHRVVESFVRGNQVWDLGAGDMGHARTLLQLGATEIVAIDKDPRPSEERIRVTEAYFTEVTPPNNIQVAFVSWPSNHQLPGLLPLLEVSEVVIYLGSNTSMDACGWVDLYEHLTRRELLAHVPYWKNSLIVCGDPLPEGDLRPATPEETAALTGVMMPFEMAVEVAETVGRAVREEAQARLADPLDSTLVG